jgi:hypothetical protein
MWNFSLIKPADFRAPARKVTRVFLHCTDSDNEHLVGVGLAAEVNRWHLANGWAGIGYSFIVDKAGAISTGRPLDIQPAAQLGPDGLGNVATIAISTHLSKMWTEAELVATRELVRAIDAAYAARGEEITVWGHTEIDPRPCPVYPWRQVMGLDAGRRFGRMPFSDCAALANEPPIKPAASWPKLAIVDPPQPAIGARPLSEGCHGADVERLQLTLTGAGFDTQGVDGWFGRNTFGAVVAWQRAHGVTPANGIVAPGAI